ncbi:hypothetical protein GOODEAATRI_008043 [Goodea atripinnis]|uniref:Uncharacterized protein n=1 Tax=Goodea atripinnis TaxID=208336 RepID=A0ABV0NIE2_9TELE
MLVAGKKNHCASACLRKAYETVPRKEMWYYMRKSSGRDSETVVRCVVKVLITIDWLVYRKKLQTSALLQLSSAFREGVALGLRFSNCGKSITGFTGGTGRLPVVVFRRNGGTIICKIIANKLTMINH